MKVSTARRKCANAVRARAPADEIIRVVEVDAATERDVLEIADGLADTVTSDSGESGPAVVAVMARGRQESQAIDLTCYTIMRGRVEIELAEPGRSRGLAALDHVETAMSNLPEGGLPPLFVESSAARLDVDDTRNDPLVHVYLTRCTWPSAYPEIPVDMERGGGMDAIRDHFAAAITEGLPAATVPQVGAVEADRRRAIIDGLVPRACIKIETRRETIGGEHDLAVIGDRRWTDQDGVEWGARVAEQLIVVTLELYHLSEQLADEATTRIMAILDDSSVNWPGSFDARVLDPTTRTLVTERRTGGNYFQKVSLLNRNPAMWDEREGLAKSIMQANVQSVSQLAPATSGVTVTTMEHAAEFKIPGRDSGG